MPEKGTMTKTEWDACTSALPMLRFLAQQAGTPIFYRFARECCRRVEDFVPAAEKWKLEKLDELAGGNEDLEDHPVIKQSVTAAENCAGWVGYAQATDDEAGKVSFARAAVHEALLFGPFEMDHDPCRDLSRFKWYSDRVEAEYVEQAKLLRRIAPRHLRFDP
jgi:hypothetical protein